MWSLPLPQVAATLAATLGAHKMFVATGQPLLDSRMANAVLVVVLYRRSWADPDAALYAVLAGGAEAGVRRLVSLFPGSKW